jgi:EpsI family protein
MKLIPFRAVLVLVAMLLATGLSVAAKPRTKVADQGPKIDLEQLVPKSFGDWKMDDRVVPVLPSPEQQALLNRIYNQTLARTYVNGRGERMMLSIAYGGDQSDGTQMHRPEVCYAAQGFQVGQVVRGVLNVASRELPVVRLVARQGGRFEPITYWMTVGDRAVHSTLEHKLAQMRYGLSGKVPDGLLVRVSSITPDRSNAYGAQRAFVEALLSALPPDSQRRLVGMLRAPDGT